MEREGVCAGMRREMVQENGSGLLLYYRAESGNGHDKPWIVLERRRNGRHIGYDVTWAHLQVLKCRCDGERWSGEECGS